MVFLNVVPNVVLNVVLNGLFNVVRTSHWYQIYSFQIKK